MERLTVTVEEAAEALGISKSLAYKMAREGDLPVKRLGRRVLVPVESLRAMVAAAS